MAWFASGMVMMFVDDMPYLSARPEFWDKLPVLNFSAARVRLADAARGLSPAAESVELGMFEGRPVYRFGQDGAIGTVFADDGSRLQPLNSAKAQAVGASWSGFPAASPEAITDDQWTIYAGAFRAHRPLQKIRLEDGLGTDLYVSSTTGEVVQSVNSRQRFWGYLGPVVHWFYYTPVRRERKVWSPLVISLSALGSLMCLSGLIIGVWQFAWARRKSPFVEFWISWHHVLGLLFGFFAFTWVFSGMLSMTPFGGSWPDEVGDAQARLAGGPLDLSRFKLGPQDALKRLGPDMVAKKLELIQVAGRPYYLARSDASHSRLILADGSAAKPLQRLDPVQLEHDFMTLFPGHKLLNSGLIEDYDAYYYSKRRTRPLPALKVVFDDGEKTTWYLDPSSGRVLLQYGRLGRVNRWLYSGLHRWDFPLMLRSLNLWYLVVMLFMLAGTVLSVTGVIISWKWLKRRKQ